MSESEVNSYTATPQGGREKRAAWAMSGEGGENEGEVIGADEGGEKEGVVAMSGEGGGIAGVSG